MKINETFDLKIIQSEIYNGEKEGLNKFEYFLELGENLGIGFKAIDFNKKYFVKLKGICDQQTYDKLIDWNNFRRSDLASDMIIGTYNFPVYFQIVATTNGSKEFLILASYGERNKGIFSFVLESYMEILIK